MKTIYIDPGHGGKDPGAVSDGFIEKDLNLKVAFAASDYLRAHYVCTVIMSRATDGYVSVTARYNDAIARKVDCCVSIHHNAGGGDGAEVWHWPTSACGRQLATLVAQELKAIGQNLRTGAGLPEGVKGCVKGGVNLGMVRVPAGKGIPAILGEFAFVDNATDRVAVNSDWKLQRQGEAYAKGIAKFLQLAAKSEPTVTPTLTTTPQSNEEVALEIYKGVGGWGDGQTRIDRLTKKGYVPDVVQALVNKLVYAQKTPTVPVNPPAEMYTLVTDVAAYSNAANAKAGYQRRGTVQKGTYYVFVSTFPMLGMINVTKTDGTAGDWINPADNVVVTPKPTAPVTPPTSPPVTTPVKPEITVQPGTTAKDNPIFAILKAIFKLFGGKI